MAQPIGFAVSAFGFPLARIGFYVDDAGNLFQVTLDKFGQQVIVNLSAGGGGGGGNGVWGQITGTLSNQTDLQAALTALTNAAVAAQTSANNAQTTANSKISALSAASDFVTASLATSNTSIANGLAAAAAGGAPVAWTTYTPNASNAVPIAIDRANGVNVMLNSPVDNTQIVNVPLNMTDGQEMQINLIGGGGSGAWTTWSSGSPTTAGFVFLLGAAPTAPPTNSNYVPNYVKRRGFKYEVTIGTSAVV